MSQRIVTECDRHLGEDGDGEQVEGAPQVIALDGVELVVDLCPDCNKELLDELRALLDAFGRRTDGVVPRARRKPPAAPTAPAAPRSGRGLPVGRKRYSPDLYAEFFLATRDGEQVWECPEGDFTLPSASKSSQNNMGAHVLRAHGVPLGEMLAERLGPERVARLVNGRGGVLEDP